MNELKPEDVIRALDILDKMDFFQGQRAGRELWFEKPFEVQEQDVADFSQGIEFVKNLITNALALLRGKDALIEDYRQELGRARVALNDANVEIERLNTLCSICPARGHGYSQGWNEAITEFAERIIRFYASLPGKTVGGSVEYHVKQVRDAMLKEGGAAQDE